MPTSEADHGCRRDPASAPPNGNACVAGYTGSQNFAVTQPLNGTVNDNGTTRSVMITNSLNATNHFYRLQGCDAGPVIVIDRRLSALAALVVVPVMAVRSRSSNGCSGLRTCLT